MEKKITWTIVLFLFVLSVCGQDIRQKPTRQEADLKNGREDTSRINALLKLAQFNILKPGENKTDLDSAATFLGQAEKLNEKLQDKEAFGYITLVQSELNRENAQQQKGKELAEKAIGILKSIKSSQHLGDAYMELSSYYNFDIQSQSAEKIKLVELAVQAYEQEGKKLKYAYSLQLLADLYESKEDQQKALQAIKLSLASYQSIHYRELQGVYIIFSSIYTLGSDYKQALNYGLMALKTAESVQDTTMQLCEINNVVAVIFGKLGERQKAIVYYKKALQIAEKYNDHPSIMLIVSNIVNSQVNMGKYRTALEFIKSIPVKFLETKNPTYAALISNMYCRVYVSLKAYDRAKPYADDLLKILALYASELTDLDNTYTVLVEYFTATRQYGLARSYLIKRADYIKAEPFESPMKVAKNNKLWFKLDSTMGNYRSAVGHLSNYYRIKDSIFNETQTRQLKQLEVQYETEKKENELKIKDKDIRFLHEKEQLQQSKLQQANLLRNVTIAGLLSLFIIIFLLLRQYTHKQQSNRIVQQNNAVITHKNELLERLLKEKEWLLKEVHHRVKNNLHTVICLLESQAVYLENDALKAIENSQHRIYAMSLIHQKLYQSEDVKTIDMSYYLPEFARYLNDAFGTQRQIRFQLDIEPIRLGVSQAIPIALILNEAVTNAIKYAFPDDKKGLIAISMHQTGDIITLSIADNGIGIDPMIIMKPSDSLGMKLMRGLSDDINSELSISNDRGTRITMRFNVDPLIRSNNFEVSLAESEIFT